ncbi:hypothetical protein MMC25_007073 [Agyrium rufum]|nr:hypothetical protein [Agyrium rufum]
MTLVLDHCQDEDFPEMMDVAFGTMRGMSAFVNSVYPHNMTAEGRDKHRQTFLYLKSVDPSQRWLKVTDTKINRIIGVANWQVYDGEKPPEDELDGPAGTWDTPDDKEWAQAMFRAYMEDRRRVIREAKGPVMCLSILCVLPEHQYRGAGTMLTKWGADLADEIGAECTVESSLAGRLLYEQQGFVLQRHYLLKVPEKFTDRKKERLYYMLRTPKRLPG